MKSLFVDLVDFLDVFLGQIDDTLQYIYYINLLKVFKFFVLIINVELKGLIDDVYLNIFYLLKVSQNLFVVEIFNGLYTREDNFHSNKFF